MFQAIAHVAHEFAANVQSVFLLLFSLEFCEKQDTHTLQIKKLNLLFTIKQVKMIIYVFLVNNVVHDARSSRLSFVLIWGLQ